MLDKMTGTRIALLSIFLAGSSGIAAGQAIDPGATAAVQFLTEWGWLGLFVLSAFLNIYQFKRAEKQAVRFAADIHALRDKYEIDIDALRDKHEADLKSSTDKLIQEYQIRIQQLSVRGK